MSAAALVRVGLLLGAAGALELACRTGMIDRFTMIPPSEMAAALVDVLASGRVNADLAFTLGNVVAAIAVSVVLGFALGVAIHAWPRLRRVVAPMLAAYYAVPTFAFYPICVVIFGVNRLPLIAIGAIFGVVAMIVSTIDGMDRIPRAFIKTARNYRMSPLATALLVQLPAAARISSPASSSRSAIR